MAADPLVRPEYGPSLPALLEERRGVRRRTTAIVAIVVLVLVAAGIHFGRSTPSATGPTSASVRWIASP